MAFPGQQLLQHPLVRRLGWVLFGIPFYLSGETATIWLLEPAHFSGGWQWLWLGLFPLLLPSFFILQRRFGCASGACRNGTCAADPGHPPNGFPPPA